MLGDIESDILSVVGEAIEADTGAYSSGDLDNPIKMMLADLSKTCPLDETDDSQSLAANDESLDEPTDFIHLVAITLTNASGAADAPLNELPGGQREYRRLRDNDSSVGQPEWYSNFDSKFWLWRPSNGVYTAKIEYGRAHPQTPTAILYGENARTAIYAGVCYYKALLKRANNHIVIWKPVYEEEKENLRQSWSFQPAITGA